MFDYASFRFWPVSEEQLQDGKVRNCCNLRPSAQQRECRVLAEWTQNMSESVITSAEAAGGMVKSPNEIAPDRYVYYPGTEVLAEDEVRVIACGTGMPDQRRAQASACFLFEFGNGEKLIFDIGTGSMRNINALMIPAQYLTKVFLSHLHTDHWGDLDALWAGGWTSGRPVPQAG
jgi:ribonuclease Z